VRAGRRTGSASSREGEEPLPHGHGLLIGRSGQGHVLCNEDKVDKVV
jgi:hypothetical protein